MHRRIYRTRLALFAFLALSVLSHGASAQQLFTFTEPEGPASVRAFSNSGDGEIGPAIEPVRIEIDPQLLAAAPQRLVLPAFDGGWRIIDQRHFEKRDDGSVTWSGSAGGEAHEHSLFTVHDGYTVGSFAIDGVRYSLLAGPDGIGTLTPESTEDAAGDWCLDHAPELSGADLPRYDSRPDSPARVSSRSTNGGGVHEIDILFFYTPLVEEVLGDPNLLGVVTVGATVQRLVDFANMVYRNSYVPVRIRVVGIEPDPWPTVLRGNVISMLNLHPDFVGHIDREHMNAVHAVRREYDADLSHFLTVHWRSFSFGVCGEASIYPKGWTPQLLAPYGYGETNLLCDLPGQSGSGFSNWTFVHEVGHTFGAQHSREIPHALSQRELDNLSASDRDDVCAVEGLCDGDQNTVARAEYAFGALVNPRASKHHLPLGDGTWWPWAPDELTCFVAPATPGCAGADGTELPDAKNAGAITVMGYDRGPNWKRVPYFSTAHLWLGEQDDYGLKGEQYDSWLLGSEKYSDVARLHAESAPDIASLSDYQYVLSRAPSHVAVTTRKSTTDPGLMEVTVEFDDNSTDEWDFRIHGTLPNGQERVCPLEPGVWFPCKWSDSTGRRSYTFTRPFQPESLHLRVGAWNDDGPTWSGDPVITNGLGRPGKPVLGASAFQGADMTVDVTIGKGGQGGADRTGVELVMCPCTTVTSGFISGPQGIHHYTTWLDADGMAALPVAFGQDYQLLAYSGNDFGLSVSDVHNFTAPARAPGSEPGKPIIQKVTYLAGSMTLSFKGVSSDTQTLRLRIFDYAEGQESALWSVLGDLKVPTNAKGKGTGSLPFVSGRRYAAILEATNGSGVTESDTFRFIAP